MTPAADADAERPALRAEVAHLRRVNAELLGTVAELRATVERQQAHIDRLVRMAFGRKSERVVTGPTLFDDVPGPDPPRPPSDAPVEPVPPPEPAATKRRGHGRRPLPADLPLRGRGFGRRDRLDRCVARRTWRVGTGNVVEQGRAGDHPLALPAEGHPHEPVDVGLLPLDRGPQFGDGA